MAVGGEEGGEGRGREKRVGEERGRGGRGGEGSGGEGDVATEGQEGGCSAAGCQGLGLVLGHTLAHMR